MKCEKTKALSLLQAFKESADWALLLTFCDDSQTCAYVFKQLHSPQVRLTRN